MIAASATSKNPPIGPPNSKNTSGHPPVYADPCAMMRWARWQRQSLLHQELHGRIAGRIERVHEQFVSRVGAVPVAVQEDAVIGHPPHFALLDQDTLRKLRQ